MFTPPASPAPPRVFRQPSPSPSVSDDEGSSQYLLVLPPRSSSLGPSSSSLTLPSSLLPKPHKAQSQHVASIVAKQRTARRTRWAVLLVPAVLILITLSTRYLSHPAVLDILSTNYDAPSWEMWSTTLTDFKPHKRHASPDPEPQQASSLIAFPTPTTTLTSSASSASVSSSSTASTNSGTQTIPTIPASPPTLPTPFPQPLDDTLSQNFTTISCQDFFQNMTQSTAFRSCRAFSLLSQSSDAFIQQAQDNITSLNAIIWGTCHTDVDADTCTSNMAWFTDALADQCADDLKAGNPIVQQTQTGLS
ncbi:hypothetical protein PHLCEN_2v1188 [Hermanssonia centrifuga]|uniref:DUF7729 domain-containing protein n=1 Tax=Hermanssonia centrifuga TaxID=98765 RepID=A0A2R6S3X9_9APHY|nr:hypothetical protein PHLCEN_2v1188 [Hermanssonia centrifuga]